MSLPLFPLHFLLNLLMILFIPTFQYYLKTGTCKFGATCKFHHPRDKAGIAGRVALNILGYPLRPVWVYISLTCVWLIGFWHIIVLSCLISFFFGHHIERLKRCSIVSQHICRFRCTHWHNNLYKLWWTVFLLSFLPVYLLVEINICLVMHDLNVMVIGDICCMPDLILNI